MAPSPHRGGITIFFCKADHFTLEALRLHSPSVVNFKLISGGQRWHVVDCCIAPDEASTIDAVVAAIGHHPHGEELLVAREFNSDLAASEWNASNKKIAVDLSNTGMEDVITHLIPRNKPWFRDRETWSMLRGGQEVHNRTEYILGTDHHMLKNVLVWGAWHNIDYYLVLGCLH